jgi:aminomethyltransferase
MTSVLSTTPLHAWHAAHGGRLVDFAGWEMPVQYTSIVDEHRATRSAAGLFDVSHMGRLLFSGPDAEAFLDRLVTRRVVGMQPGQIRYALVTNDQAGILDDVLVYRLAPTTGGHAASPYEGASHQLVVNASNREKIIHWIDSQRRPDEQWECVDQTTHTAMLAVQGPHAVDLVRTVLGSVAGEAATRLKYYHSVVTTWAGSPLLASRTGYTGEDGWELIVPAEKAVDLWQQLLEQGRAAGAKAAGLGARDTLRLEAGMPLYGHELSETIDPLEAGLAFAVDLEGRTFAGRDVLARQVNATDRPVRVGLVLEGKRVPREGYGVLAAGQPVGRVTSGTFSPTLERPIAMGYVQPDAALEGTNVEVDIRGRREAARVVALPFYRR